MQIDKEYENALRCYIDNTFCREKLPDDVDSVDLNVVKPLYSYIQSLASEIENFKFSTPIYGWWDLTSACNFRCIHCLYNDREYSDSNDLSSEEAYSLAQELINDFGIASINLTGGEIFLRKDTIDIIRLFKENNVSVRLATNAALLDDYKIEALAEMLDPYADMMQISLDGATHETFKKIRKTDTFEKITGNIDKLTKRGVTVNIAYTVNNINYHEVEKAFELSDKLGVKCFTAGRMLCLNDSHRALEVSDRDLLLLATKMYNKNLSSFKTEFNNGFFTVLTLLNLPGAAEILEEAKYSVLFEKFTEPLSRECNYHDRISIRSDGRVYMCMQAENCPASLMGNYRENSLMEIWEKRHNNIFFQHRTLENSKCGTCKYNVICNSGCKVHSYNKFGDVNLPEIDCKFALK